MLMSPMVEEFYNRCHAGANGKFCGTSGGNKAGRSASQRATAAKASVAKVGHSGSKIVGKSASKGGAQAPSSPGQSQGKGSTVKKVANKGHGADSNASRLLAKSGSKSWGVNSQHSNKGKRTAMVKVSKKVAEKAPPAKSHTSSEIDRLTKMVQAEKSAAPKKAAPSAPSKAYNAGVTTGKMIKTLKKDAHGLSKEVQAKVIAKAQNPKSTVKVPKTERVMKFLDKASSVLKKLQGETSGTRLSNTSQQNARANSEIARRKRDAAYKESKRGAFD